MARILLLFLVSAALSAASTAQAPSEETIEFFKLNCASCHTIGGGALTGPDLKGVTERKDRAWLESFILDPRGVIDSGDPYALELLRKARGQYMPQIPGLTRDRASKLLDLIEIESALEKSQFAGLQISDRPLTAADVALGEQLFLGQQAFASGAPACFSCHTNGALGGFGGGSLGPDLTTAYARLEGRKALSAWLSAPPSLVMQPVYKQTPLDGEEVLALVAYLENVAASQQGAARPPSLALLLSGIGGAAVILVLFDYLWRGRYRSVRRPLVQGAQR